MKKLISGILFLLSSSTFAFNTNYLMRSPEGLLMGDAYTAVNSDSFTLFYNPASMARHRRDFTLNALNVQVDGTNVISDMDRFKDVPSEIDGLTDLLMDYPVHVSAGTAPGFKLFNVGVSFIANESLDVLLRNPAHPMLDIDLRSDRGVMLGVGVPLGSSRINPRSKWGSQTSLGVSAKYIERTGVRDTLALTGPQVLETIGKDELSQIIKSLGQVKGTGYGFDAGLEHVTRAGNSQFVFGLAALDITGTKFKVSGSGGEVQDIKDQINVGMAFGQDYRVFNYLLSADVRSLNEEMDFGRRLRLGLSVGVPGLKLMAGMNSGYYSYGASLEMAIFKLTAGFYDMELGTEYKQTKSRRFIVYLSLFDFSFDS